jgi:hypothetical protein
MCVCVCVCEEAVIHKLRLCHSTSVGEVDDRH